MNNKLVLKIWLEGFDMAMYTDSFVASGFDNLESVLLMDENDFKACGVVLPGHLKRLKLEIAKLNSASAPSASTAKIHPDPVASTHLASTDTTEVFIRNINSHKFELSTGCVGELLCCFALLLNLPLRVLGFWARQSGSTLCRKCNINHAYSCYKECIDCGICGNCAKSEVCPGRVDGNEPACCGDWMCPKVHF